jgi:hypothetical protein
MNNVYYDIDFTDRVSTETIRYKIVDTPVSRMWLDRVRWHLALPNCRVFENQWIVTPPTLKAIEDLWRVMKLDVDKANSGEYIKVDHIEMPDEYNNDIDVAPILNYLHYEFHKYEETTEALITHYSPLTRLNVDIHRLETMVKQFKGKGHNVMPSAGFFLTGDALRSPTGGDRTVPIEDQSLYEYFNYNPKFGDLQLGYHTVGKNICHCYKDNDVDLVKKRMLRPQTTISNEVMLKFPRINEFDGFNKQLPNMLRWVHANVLDEYVDMSLPINRVVSHPLLGEMTNGYTFDDVCNILSLGTISTVRLVE